MATTDADAAASCKICSTDELEAAYSGLTSIIDGLSDLDLLLPSGCRGWTIADLLLHVNGDAQGALVAFASPTAAPADVDFVGYWRRFPAGSGSVAHAQWIRRSASAFERPSGIVRLWSDTAPAAVRAARAADPSGRVATQGSVFPMPDFLAILVTEAVIHHLDMIVSLPEAPLPDPAAAAVARATVDGLAAGLPTAWEPIEAIRKATGREALSESDRRLLGADADRFPVLG